MFDMQEQLYDTIKDRVDKIYLSSLYDEDENPEIYEEEHWNDLAWTVKADDVAYGASKVVFWFNDIKDYVIKVPLQGRYSEYIEDYEDFTNAHFTTALGDTMYADWDYCGAEAQIYDFITKEYPHLAKFFAATFLIGVNIHGVPVYAAKNIKDKFGWESSKETSPVSYEKAQLVVDTFGHCGGLNTSIIAIMYDQYEESDVDDLLNFILEYRIDDLHTGNIGFDENGKIVIMDYSGFDS